MELDDIWEDMDNILEAVKSFPDVVHSPQNNNLREKYSMDGWDSNDIPEETPYQPSHETKEFLRLQNQWFLSLAPLQPKKQPPRQPPAKKAVPPRKRVAGTTHKKRRPKRKLVPKCFQKKKPPTKPVKPSNPMGNKTQRKNISTTTKKMPTGKSSPPKPETPKLVLHKRSCFPATAAKKPTKSKHKKANPNPTNLPNTNYQGYPMKQCEYEPMEQCYVFRPPGYGNKKSLHCCSCRLKPCITASIHIDTRDFPYELDIAQILEKKRCQLFANPYNPKSIPPGCITNYAMRLARSTDSEYESSDSEESIMLNSSSIQEYRLLRDRQVGDAPTNDLMQTYDISQTKLPQTVKPPVRVSIGTPNLARDSARTMESPQSESDQEFEF
jgi:hypothetical protein